MLRVARCNIAAHLVLYAVFLGGCGLAYVVINLVARCPIPQITNDKIEQNVSAVPLYSITIQNSSCSSTLTSMSRVDCTDTDSRKSLRQSFGYLDYPDAVWTSMLLKAEKIISRQRTIRKRNKKVAKSWGRVGLGYDPALHCAREQRFGKMDDGGKWVCDAYRIAEKEDCNIVSVGSNNDWSFEIMMHRLNPRCTIHTFDHTIQPKNKPDFVKWWPIGIAESNEGQLATIPTALEKCGLTGKKIDVFKIDCEGCEYRVFNNTDLKSLQLQQILIELHAVARYKYKNGMFAIAPTAIDNFFDFMARNDYMIFHKEAWSGCCTEYSFIRMAQLQVSRG